MSCRLIINADDFGWSTAVNEAVSALHAEGVVTSTSLMVGAGAAADAVTRLESCPSLAVGLHVALVGAPPLLPAGEVPHLIDREGHLRKDCLRAGIAAVGHGATRRELRRETEAQFKAFAGLGLPWSHVDFHMHFCLTPGVLAMALDVASRYPVVGFRVPEDDYALYSALDPADARRQWAHALWIALSCRTRGQRLRERGYRTTQRCYGFFRTHRLETAYLTRLVEQLPEGDLELHCHPDLSTDAGRTEFEALRSPEFRRALRNRGVILSTYKSLGTGGAELVSAPRQRLPLAS